MPKKARSRPEVKAVPSGFADYLKNKIDASIGFKKKDLAALIDISPSNFSQKMKFAKFKQTEMVKLFKATGATNEEIAEAMRR